MTTKCPISVEVTTRTKMAIFFKAVYGQTPSDEDVSDAQAGHGYHPAGYGSPMGINLVYLPDGTVAATWSCWANCD